MSLKDFIDAYIDCALWCGLDEDMQATPDDLSDKCREALIEDATDFYQSFSHLFAGNDEQAGHDFWLSRNHHGAGFWDNPGLYGAMNALELTEMAHAYGEGWLYVGDDGYVEWSD